MDNKYQDLKDREAVSNDGEETLKKLQDAGEVIKELLREAREIKDWDSLASLLTRKLKTRITTNPLFRT